MGGRQLGVICTACMQQAHAPWPASIMFIGGPNQREDFHLDVGSEFFYQMRGNMSLPIIEKGKRKDVHIKEGHVFLLPPRIPHSPQRPEWFGGACGGAQKAH